MIPRGSPPASFSQLQRPLIPFQSSTRGSELPHRNLAVYVKTHNWGTTDFLHPRQHLDSLNFCSNHTDDSNNNNNDFFHCFLLLSRRANYLLLSMTFVSSVTVSKFLQAEAWMVTSSPECSPRVLVILFVLFFCFLQVTAFFFKSKENICLTNPNILPRPLPPQLLWLERTESQKEKTYRVTFFSFPCMVNVLYSIYVYRLYLPCDVHTMNDIKSVLMCHWIFALALLFVFSSSVLFKRTNRHQRLYSKAVCTQHSLPHSSPELWISSQELQAEPEGVAPEGLTEAEPGPCPSPSPNWVFLVPIWAYQDHSDIPGAGRGGPGLLHRLSP